MARLLPDVHRRIIRSPVAGREIDDCIGDGVPDDVLNRYLPAPEDVRIELLMNGELKLNEIDGADISELFSQRLNRS